LRKAVAGHVGKGELAQVAQALGQQEGDDRPAHQKADGVDQPVIAGGHHGRRDAQEGRRRHVVAGNRQAVLKARDAAAGGVEIGRRLGAAAAHLVIHSVAATNAVNMMMAIQLVACLAASPGRRRRPGLRRWRPAAQRP
jgi:hypothetical protein